jgi:selenocysteine lyase/cysteine desulfurase
LHYPASNRDACSPFVKSDFKNDALYDEANDMKPILLVDHGSCSQITKVTNVMKAGLRAAILIDNDAEDYYELRKS